MRHAAALVLLLMLSSCSKKETGEGWYSPPVAKLNFGIDLQKFEVKHGRILGSVRNGPTRGFREIWLTIHLLNPAGERISEQLVHIQNLLPNEAVRVDETVTMLTAEQQKGKMISLATETDRTLFFDFLPLDLGSVGPQIIENAFVCFVLPSIDVQFRSAIFLANRVVQVQASDSRTCADPIVFPWGNVGVQIGLACGKV